MKPNQPQLAVTGTSLISTRRFWARPSSVVLDARGWLSP
jgi:hypothetical protein